MGRPPALPASRGASAASLTVCEVLAPENPGVPRAITGVHVGRKRNIAHCGPSGSYLRGRPRSGFGPPTTWRFEAPGDAASAGSSTSGRLGGAIRITPSFASNRPSPPQLVERLLHARHCGRPGPGATMAADGVDLVDEDDAGRVLLALLEHLSRGTAAGTDADDISTKSEPEMVCKNGTFASPATARGDQRLAGAGAGRPAGSPSEILPPRRWNFLRILQELDDFLQLRLRLVDAGNVVEGHPPVRSVSSFWPWTCRSPSPLAAAALHLAHEEDPHADQQQHREPAEQDREQRRHAAVVRLRRDSARRSRSAG